MKICGPKGRDCIERNSSLSFNCSVSCEGVYADVQWAKEPIEEEEEEEEEDETGVLDHWKKEDIDSMFERGFDERLLIITLKNLDEKMRLMYADLEQKTKSNIENKMKKLKHMDKNDNKGDELNKKRIKKLISEYRKFKMEKVKHFRFNEHLTSNMFGKPKFGTLFQLH